MHARQAPLAPTLVRTLASRHAANAQPWIPAASVAFMAALTAASAQMSVHVPWTSVPITMQPVIVLLSGLVLGARLGAYSQCLYLAAGLVGLPVFATSALLPPGALRLLGPTGGYLMSYPLAAFLTGFWAERGLDRRWVTSVAAMWAGLAAIYLCGAAWLAYGARLGTGSLAIGFSAAVANGIVPFALADLTKSALAAAVAPGLWRLVGRGPR